MQIRFPGTGTVARQLRPDFARPEHEVSTEPDMMDKDTAELAYRRGPASRSRCCGTGRTAS